MNQQPDKIFRDKLQSYQQPVPSRTWNRVSQNLTNDNRRIVWLRVAAAVLVVITSGVFLYPVFQGSTDTPLSENIIKPKNPEPAVVIPVPQDTPPPKYNDHKSGDASAQRDRRTQGEERNQRPVITEERAITKETVVTKETPTPYNDDQDQAPPLAKLKNIEVIPELMADEMRSPEPEVPASALDEPNRKSLTIVFTTDEVNQKYLSKKENTEATQETKDASGLKRLLDKAYDLKNNQDLIGDLRQKKNEILAMNFKSDKQETVNE